MKNLIIIGARGFGREVVDFAKYCRGYKTEFIIKGFLDDKKEALDNYRNYPSIISSVEDYQIEKDDVFISGLGSVFYTEQYVNMVLNKGGVFINLIHKDAVLRENVILGSGIIVGAGSLISTDVSINDFTQIMSYCVIGHDVKIGKFCRLGDFVFVGGYSKISNNCFLAVRSTVLANIDISDHVTVGASSLVIKNIKPGITVFGHPAIELKY